MSKKWTAQCWMGSASGFVDIEVNASTSNGAIEQLKNVYGAEQIRNIRQVRTEGSSGSSLPTGGSVWILGLLGAGAAFLYLTPWILMAVYGMGSTWLVEKITNQSIEEYTDTDNPTDGQHKKALAIILSAVIFGGIGFVQGTFLHKDLMNEYGINDKVEEVRKQDNAR
jgi:hypothetical protein